VKIAPAVVEEEANFIPAPGSVTDRRLGESSPDVEPDGKVTAGSLIPADKDRRIVGRIALSVLFARDLLDSQILVVENSVIGDIVRRFFPVNRALKNP
jgi:hypothetical protein